MSDGPLLNDVTRAFAEAHRNEDVRDLALKTKRTADLDLPAALDQIAGWQIARNKLPQWAACADIVYPAHISMEQCSSQFTAQYKAEIARRLLRSLPQSAGQTANDATMTDLTGGFGVDFSYLARGFGHATYVERQSHLCELAAHNMAALGLTQAQVVCGDGFPLDRKPLFLKLKRGDADAVSKVVEADKKDAGSQWTRRLLHKLRWDRRNGENRLSATTWS